MRLLAPMRATSRIFRGPRYIVEVFDGPDDVFAALETIQNEVVGLGFQSLNWLTILYEELAVPFQANPRLVIVSERNSGEVILTLPLTVVQENGLRVARFADLGVTDYGAPLLGPVKLTTPRAQQRVWRAIRQSMRDVDVIELQNMPDTVEGQPNPLVSLARVVRSRQKAFYIKPAGTVDAYIASRGKKFRKEVARCQRVWEREGETEFYRATTPEQIARVFSTLEEQQIDRRTFLKSDYVLDQPAYRAFYERLAMDGTAAGLTYIFAIEAQGEIIATLFGIVNRKTFTMLRITFGGERSAHMSPGRIVILQAMRNLEAQGINEFDLGIGDYDYKRRLGAEPVTLFDLISAPTARGWPTAAYLKTRARLRQNRHLKSLYHRLKPASPPKHSA